MTEAAKPSERTALVLAYPSHVQGEMHLIFLVSTSDAPEFNPKIRTVITLVEYYC